MDKIYLLLVLVDNRIDLKEFRETGRIRPKEASKDWILQDSVGVHTIGGFKLTEEEARYWALERCKIGEELPEKEISEEIVKVEKLVYVDSKCVLITPDRHEKRTMFRGFSRQGLELPTFGYIVLYENRDSNNTFLTPEEVRSAIEGEKNQEEEDIEYQEEQDNIRERNEDLQRKFNSIDLRK